MHKKFLNNIFARADRAPVALVSEVDRKKTATKSELEQLLKQQSELALNLSPEGEAAYQACIADIARVSALIDAEKQTEPHHA